MPRTRLRVGGVPTLFDAPLQSALVGDKYTGLDINLNWVKCPRDTGAVVSMLTAGLLDLAFLFTEDAVAYASAGALRICGTFVNSAREWGLHVPAAQVSLPTVADLDGYAIGMPDDTGAALMLGVLAEREGWERLGRVRRKRYASVRRAEEAVTREFVQSVLWERRMASGLVDCGEWDLVHVQDMPWPAVMIVGTKESIYSKGASIRHFIDYAQAICQEFKNNVDLESSKFLLRYGLSQVSATSWLEQTVWPCHCEVYEPHLTDVLRRLEAGGLLARSRISEPSRLLARGLCELVGGGTEESLPVAAAAAVQRSQLSPCKEEEDMDFEFVLEPTTDLVAEASPMARPMSEESASAEPKAAALVASMAPAPAGAELPRPTEPDRVYDVDEGSEITPAPAG